MAAFPRATALDFGARGAGQSLTSSDLAEACSPLAGQLEDLDISGAFLVTSAGLRRVLCACTALRSLCADGSTVENAAFARLGDPQQDASHAAEMQMDDSNHSLAGPQPPVNHPGEPSSSGAAAQRQQLGLQRLQPAGAPLQRLERLSLRGCMFLSAGVLADLAAACPALSYLNLAGCGLALK